MAEGGLSLGIDLGGTQVRAALVRNGEVLRRAAEKTDVLGGPPGVLAQIGRMAGEVLSSVERRALGGAGLCAPGPLDTETGTVLGIPTLPGWENFPLRHALGRALGLPVAVENDGIAAAFGEWRHGAGRGLKHLVYVTVSTGIGGGVVLDGRLLHGRRGMAAHVGHFPMAPDGPRCSCGAIGCFEAFAAGPALAKRARQKGRTGHLATLQAADARDVAGGALQGDATCLALLAEEAELLGRGFTGLVHLFSPERVIMGGGVSQAFDLMAPRIRAVIRETAMAPFKDVPVVRAALGDDSGLVGAAALALEAD